MDHFTRRFEWLTGTWTLTLEENSFETWEVTEDGLSGTSYQIIGGKKVVREKITLQHKDGDIWYSARAMGQNSGKTVPFRLSSQDEHIYRFTNPNHDFPNTIVYERLDENHILAWIEGVYQGVPRRVDFPMERADAVKI